MISFTIYQLVGTLGFAVLLVVLNVALWREVIEYVEHIRIDYDGDDIFLFCLLFTAVSIVLICVMWRVLGLLGVGG